MNRNRFLGVVLVGVAASLGCGRPVANVATDATDAHSVSLGAQPKEYLQAIFARYRSAGTYSDHGQVRLFHDADGNPTEQTAPISVRWDHGQLYVEAYDLRLFSTRDELAAWSADPTSKQHDSQVLRSPAIAGRPSLERLLRDPVVRQQIGAGLAGPPPQLEWLFAPKPMQKLFHADNQFEFGRSRMIQGTQCTSIRVTAQDDGYVFWVDTGQGVIRQVDLPAIEPVSGRDALPIGLSLEFTDACFCDPEESIRLRDLPEQPRDVRRFVPLPPQHPAHVLGMSVEPTQISPLDRGALVQLTGTDFAASLLVQFEPEPQAIEAVGLLHHWVHQMPTELRDKLQVVLLVPNRSAEWSREIASQTPFRIADEQGFNEKLSLAPGSLAILNQRGTVAWVQSPLLAGDMTVVGAILQDVFDGVDVPARAAEQWRAAVATYKKALAEAAAANN